MNDSRYGAVSRRVLLAIAGILLLAALVDAGGSHAFHKYSAEDAAWARQVGREIESGFPGFVDRAVADATHRGKTYYLGSRGPHHTEITFYEVTSPGDIDTIKALARQAMAAAPGVQRVTLRFFEAQVWEKTPDRGEFRRQEKLLDEVTLRPSARQ